MWLWFWKGQLLPMSRGRIPIGNATTVAAQPPHSDGSPVIPHPHLVRELIELKEKRYSVSDSAHKYKR